MPSGATTISRCRIPIWGAARPMPLAPLMIRNISSIRSWVFLVTLGNSAAFFRRSGLGIFKTEGW